MLCYVWISSFIDASHVYNKIQTIGCVGYDSMSISPANSVTSRESLNHLAPKDSILLSLLSQKWIIRFNA